MTMARRTALAISVPWAAARGLLALVCWFAVAVNLSAADEGAYEKVGFDRLANYRFVPPSPDVGEDDARSQGEQQIPEEIRALNGKKTLVTGYMLPVRLESGKVTEFLLVKDPSMCCFGTVPAMNEWVVVKMKTGGVAPLMDVPISFYGVLKVGPTFENGYMTGIYELVGERVGEVGT